MADGSQTENTQRRVVCDFYDILYKDTKCVGSLWKYAAEL